MEGYEGVDHLPPLCLRTWSGIVVLVVLSSKPPAWRRRRNLMPEALPILSGKVALPHEKSAFVLFTKSFVSKYFPPLHLDHLFSYVAWHNKRKWLSYVDFGRFFMRQLAALLSFWQNGSASDHFRGGESG
jgi:hypothetical protein